MSPGGALEYGRELLARREHAEAVRELKKVAVCEPENSEGHYLLSTAYYRLAVSEKSSALFILSEDAIKTALKLRPEEPEYHDQLMAASSKLGKLGELSREYRILAEQEEGSLYADMLKKIAAVSIAAIPQPKTDSRKNKALPRFLINYMVMPSLVAGGIFSWFSGEYRELAIGPMALAAAYIYFRVSSRSKSRPGGDW